MPNNLAPALVNRALEQIDRGRLVDLVVQLVNVPSPTGFEGDMAKDGPNKGKRAVNGWKNIGMHWSYNVDQSKVTMGR